MTTRRRGRRRCQAARRARLRRARQRSARSVRPSTWSSARDPRRLQPRARHAPRLATPAAARAQGTDLATPARGAPSAANGCVWAGAAPPAPHPASGAPLFPCPELACCGGTGRASAHVPHLPNAACGGGSAQASRKLRDRARARGEATLARARWRSTMRLERADGVPGGASIGASWARSVDA